VACCRVPVLGVYLARTKISGKGLVSCGRGDFDGSMWRLAVSAGLALSCADLSCGLSAAEVRRCAARCQWWLAAAASWVRGHDSRVVGHRSSQGKPKCSPLTLLMVAAGVAVQLILRRRVGIGRSFGRKPYPAMEPVSTTTTSSGVVVLLEGVCWDASCLVFV
jgi:hypothetical protein